MMQGCVVRLLRSPLRVVREVSQRPSRMASVSERPSARAPNESARGQAPRRGWSKTRRGSDRGSKTVVCPPSIYYLEETRNEQIAHPCPASPAGRRYRHPGSGGGCHGGGIDAGGDRAGAAI